MRRHISLLVVLSLLGAFSVSVFGAQAQPASQTPVVQQPLSMVVFPRRNVKTTHRMFQPIAEHLGKSIGHSVQLVTPRDFKTFWGILTKGEFDLVHMNQYHYITSHDRFGYHAILKNVEFGDSTMRGVIAVRKDSGIKKIDGLRGKKILFGGGPRAMQSYIIPTWLLRQSGLKKGDYEEVFAKNPPNAFISAFHKQADAAGCGNVVSRLKVVKDTIDTAQMETLIEGPALPHLPWAVRQGLPDEVKLSIQKTLAGLNKHTTGQALLDNAQLTAFEIASHAEYEPYRVIIDSVEQKKDKVSSK